MNNLKLRNFEISNEGNMTLMGGMNVLESRDLAMQIAEEFAIAAQSMNINYIF